MKAQCKVAHLTSVHPRYDTRIFFKECSSLAKVGYIVSLIVADGKGNEIKNNVQIYDVGKPKNRLYRMTKTTSRVLEKAKEIDADIYHLHDPELIPIGLKLRKMGKKVIFDSHEDIPKQLLNKTYLNFFLRKLFSYLFTKYERFSCAKFNYIITATPSINEKFLKINSFSMNINNFPLLKEMEYFDLKWDEKKNQVCYIGGISAIRGIKEITCALKFIKEDITLQLAGKFNDSVFEKEVKSLPGFKKVVELGWLDRKNVHAVLNKSCAGIVTFLPAPNHTDSQPNKMFEYMSAGIPVIASNFPLWREIIEGNNCGICVDPLKPEEIANATKWLVSHPIEAEKMGQNGRNAVLKKYNWEIEEKKLLELYSKI